MPITLDGSNGITTPMYNGSITANAVTPSVNMKNRIINGAMVIDQRNAGASGTASGYTVDRWTYQPSQASKGTWQQNAGSVTPPAGFTNYLGFTSSSAYTVGSSEFFLLQQPIEGFNTADLGFGTANAKTVNLSFWVRSSLTGTFGGALNNSAFNRSYPFSFTISAANTWEQKSVTIAGDTTGTWIGATNGVGLYVNFSLGAGATVSGTANAWAGSFFVSATGATSVVGTNGATFYLTGVQLEVGSTATSFDYRPYGTEFDLCRRYYERLNLASPATATSNLYIGSTGLAWTSGDVRAYFRMYPKRAQPSCSQSGQIRFGTGTFGQTLSSGFTFDQPGPDSVLMYNNTGVSGFTEGRALQIWGQSSGYVDFSAEL